jgi:hypothetical protein
MAKQIRNLLKGRTRLHHTTGDGAPEDVSPTDTLLESATFSSETNGAANDVKVGGRVNRRTVSYKNLPSSGLWASMAKVSDNCSASDSWQGHGIDTRAFAVNTESARSPVHIIEPKMRHFRSTQSQIEETSGDRIIPSAGPAAAVKSSE